MKILMLSLATLGLFSVFFDGTRASLNSELPKLNQIKEITLSPSYSCRSSADMKKGFENSGLFLTGPTQGSPDLLFNGACGADDYFVTATAGDDMSLIADLGSDLELANVSASKAFNPLSIHSFSAYSKFAREVKVETHHTYAVLISQAFKRGLLVFTVTDYKPNKEVSLKYAVKSYQVTTASVSSPGFQWDEKSLQ